MCLKLFWDQWYALMFLSLQPFVLPDGWVSQEAVTGWSVTRISWPAGIWLRPSALTWAQTSWPSKGENTDWSLREIRLDCKGSHCLFSSLVKRSSSSSMHSCLISTRWIFLICGLAFPVSDAGFYPKHYQLPLEKDFSSSFYCPCWGFRMSILAKRLSLKTIKMVADQKHYDLHQLSVREQSFWFITPPDKDQDGTFRWVDKTAVEFSNWSPNFPQNTADQWDCGQIYTGKIIGCRKDTQCHNVSFKRFWAESVFLSCIRKLCWKVGKYQLL